MKLTHKSGDVVPTDSEDPKFCIGELSSAKFVGFRFSSQIQYINCYSEGGHSVISESSTIWILPADDSIYCNVPADEQPKP